MSGFILGGFCLFGLALYAVFGQENNPCKGVANGKIMNLTCAGYTNCTKEQPVVLVCPNGTVVERDSLTCKEIGKGNTICGTSGTCTGNGSRAASNCQSFFNCVNGMFAANSHIYCPGVLLYNGNICDFPANVTQTCTPVK